MADTVPITAGSGTSIATDDIGTVHYQRIKLVHGADGVNDGDVAKANPLPTRPGMPTTKQLTQASISVAASGDNTLVTATVAQTTRVFRLYLVNSSAVKVDVKFKSATTDKTGAMSLFPGGSICLNFDGEPWFVTGANEAFILNLSAAAQISGWMDYEKS